jgi:hypothetical protein
MAAAIAGFAILWFEQPAQMSPLLSAIADADLERRLHDLVAQGKKGLAQAVEALGSERAALRAASYRVLHEQIDRLTIDSTDARADEAPVSIDWLAQSLASKAAELGGEGLSLAAELAERIIALSPSDGRPGMDRIRYCHRVLATQAQTRIDHRDRSGAKLLSSRTASDNFAAFRQPTTAYQSGELTPRLVDVPALAGGSLLVSPSQGEPLRLSPELIASARLLHPNVSEPDGSPTLRIAMPDAYTSKPGSMAASRMADADLIESRALDATGPDTPARRAQHSEIIAEASSRKRAKPLQTAPLPEDLQQLLALNERIESIDNAIAEAARDEAARLHIDRRQLSLAAGAADPDPRVRKEVVEALPLVGSVDVRGWLLWLSRDPAAEVRRAAISVLATSGDPRLTRQVLHAAQSDPDPTVREYARMLDVR